ncbi:MAG: 50S ribosomal protein L13 [Nitrososphaerota archaeon]|nr:50S ribosomal protein L13 [Nitrososphaerota archaeon]
MSNEVVIDAEGCILGRLASSVSKMLLEGKKVFVVNVDRIYISGGKTSVLNEWRGTLDLKSIINPKLSPIHYRRVDLLFKKVVRGMLPYPKPRGKIALTNLRAYYGVPAQFQNVPKTEIGGIKATKHQSQYVKLIDIAKELGWNGE